MTKTAVTAENIAAMCIRTDWFEEVKDKILYYEILYYEKIEDNKFVECEANEAEYITINTYRPDFDRVSTELGWM